MPLGWLPGRDVDKAAMRRTFDRMQRDWAFVPTATGAGLGLKPDRMALATSGRQRPISPRTALFCLLSP
jgi:hypothetical protein